MFKNKGLIIAIVVIALVVLGGFGYFMFSKSSKTVAPTEKTTVTEPKASSTTSVTGTLKSLLTGGKTQTCTISYPDNKGTGTIYVADKKFGGTFTIKDSDGKDMTGYMVSDGTYFYSWSSAATMGIKIKLDVAESATDNAQTGTNDLNQKVNLNCSPWIVDNSKFAVPTNIKFSDMSNLIPKTSALPSAKAGTPAKEQSVCDQIEDATAKAACIKALSGQQ